DRRRPPDRRPDRPSTDIDRCDSSTSTGPISQSGWRAPATPTHSRPTGRSSSAGSPGWTGRSSTPIRRRGRSASGAGSRSGARIAATVAAGQTEPGVLRAVEPGGDAAFLAPLPSTLLSPDADVRARLTRFGLRQIGQVAELPKTALVARFGDEGEWLHARARGEEIEPFRPRRASERLALALPIAPPVVEPESLRFVLHRLAAALASQIEARGMAAARAHLRLTLDLAFAVAGTAGEMAIEQRFPEPTADADAIERLLLARLERTPPPAPVERIELE